MTARSRGRWFVRGVLAAVVVVDLVSFYGFLGEARVDALANGVTLSAFDDGVSQPAVKALLIVLGIAGAVAFARRPGRLWEGLLALGALVVLGTVHAQLYGSPWRHLFFSGVCLAGWLLGLAVSRRQGNPRDESYAQMGSIALLGATYLNSGISKIAFGGLEWLSGLPIRVIVVGLDGLVGDSMLGAYRSWVAASPAVGGFFAVATVGFELAGGLMIIGRRTRAGVALGLLAMHTTIYVLTDILYWESMVLLALFGLSADPAPSEAVAATPVHAPASNRLYAGALVALTACAIVAIGHQARRDALSRAQPPHGAGDAPAPAPPPPAATAPRQIGPFAVGQAIAGTWAVDALELRDDAVLIAVVGAPGRARFELTCATSERRSPFDVGSAHLFYSNDLPFAQLEPAGTALQARLRDGAGSRDVCDALASWRSASQAAQPR